ncbi:MAG: DUF1906 domain-containing protein [Streptomyces sp.]|nr:DUF1906 domain-containing protein [Streptomyces sp.]
MSLTGVDIAWDRPTVAAIQKVGAHFVARYLSTDPNKNITAAEVTAYRGAGIGTVVVWETTTGRATAGRAAGVADAQAAEVERKAVGLPSDMPIHFAVDEDTTWSSVAAYMSGAASVLGQQRVGVYGGYKVIEGAAAAGYRYLWQTVAWSGGLWSTHATIRQTGGTTLNGGADWDTAETPDFGQYPRPTTPQEIDMDATQARQLAELHDLLVPYAGWAYKNADQLKANPKLPDAYGYLVGTNTAVQHLTAQVAALTAAVGALAKGGGITAAEVTAAAEAGAKAALDQLGHALDGTKP